MKKLNLANASYRYLIQSFKDWLDVQGYAASTVYNLPNLTRELLHYLEAQGITQIKQLTANDITEYYEKLKERSNHTRGGGLSGAHLNKHIQALRRFTEYLRKVGRINIPEIGLSNEDTEHKVIYLTKEEIQLLYKATSQCNSAYNYKEKQEAYQSRDRAMLTIFYACGLRRNEGTKLDTSDINFDRSILHVRHGKNYKERFVPISKASLKHLEEYVYDYRPQLLMNNSHALFLNYRGNRMQGQGQLVRLKQLQYKTDNADLQEKEIGLHTLRHSIATHFLQAGMKLESISRFLGHSSLESTQIYTHVSAEALAKEGFTRTANQPYNNIPKHERIQLSEDER